MVRWLIQGVWSWPVKTRILAHEWNAERSTGPTRRDGEDPIVQNKANYEGLVLAASGGRIVRNKANSSCQADGVHGTPCKVAEGLLCKTKPISGADGRQLRTHRAKQSQFAASRMGANCCSERGLWEKTWIVGL
jgi:hypothetical protein